ncbi:hypothetical protein EAO28_01945 [Klebsiella pneumoniae]|uniref:Uncharacterized protein n=1 Tax=Klebsiella pneumoniae TaxID=573 RepID=A0A3P2EKC3_KLEPN|nr:hypothetical protein EAO28_01945 [Klebsiella pneumoniae]
MLSQVNATSSDGRCAPYCLTSFFELLHSTIDSYDAGFVESAFFLRSPDQLLPLLRHPTVSGR